MNSSDFLRVKGNEIVNGLGEGVHLRGFCLGGWMNMENSITGYPWNETGQRVSLEQVLGKTKATFFFERFLNYFLTEDDLRFIKELGCNAVRIPLNYRHFESDDRPFEYKSEGFSLLDKVIRWASNLRLYVIIDLHAVQGWQNRGWHCDNPDKEPHFWGQKNFEDRAITLWEALASRYRDEPFVAGYNLMNEPDVTDAAWLNQYYRRATTAIRSIDSDHIVFLDGNHYAQDFSLLDPPFDNNTVYSYHFYPEPILTEKKYPCEVNGKTYNREWLEKIILERSEFMRLHHVPVLCGEFGCLYTNNGEINYSFDLMDDLIELLELHDHHWTIWTYKDIGKLGIVYANPESAWMHQTRTVRDLKTIFRCDYWVERHESEIGRYLDKMIAHIGEIVATQPGDWSSLTDNIYGAVCEYTLSQMLVPAFSEQFRGISEEDIDTIMQSFAFKNCVIRRELAEIITKQILGRSQ